MRNFIIFAPSYDEKIGGVIVLHHLASLLSEAGRDVRLWPFEKPPSRGWWPWRALLWHLRELVRRYLALGGFKVAPGACLRLARSSDLEGAIVLYPEVVDGNPLQAERVVRWFLHRPGFHTGKVGFGAKELHFFYQKAFDFKFEGAQSGGELFLVKIFTDIYKNEGKENRSGRCYILKKGANRVAGMDLSDGVVIDDLEHRDIAKIFNRVEYCISYDPYTLYSFYAAMCGCKSIIVPLEGLSKEQWQPSEELRYGLAYGEDDLEYAALTLPKLVKAWSTKDAANKRAVANFISICDAYFS